MRMLSEHFSLEEMTVSANAVRLGLSNEPSPPILARLMTVAGQMERVRDLLGGHPILISSAYRSEAVNRAAGGAKASAHMDGCAVDFTCPGFGEPLAVTEKIAVSRIRYDQLIHEHGRWVHISFDPRRRMQQLTIDGQGTRLGLWSVR
jgi:zinc D-Ala-D-Ala carboxypeptidase